MFAICTTIETAALAPEIILSFFKDLAAPTPTVGISFLSSAVMVRVVTAFCILFNVLEFLCYVIIFHEMYQHHQRHITLCFLNKPKLANMKKRKNTITACGHFVSWVVEMIIFGLLQYILLANKQNLLAWIFFTVLMPSINYLIFPSVQVIASKELREHLFNLECCAESCLCDICRSCDNTEQNDQGVGPGDVELQVTQNGHALHVWSTAYRVTHQVVTNLPLTSKQKFRFSLARPGQARPKQNFCFEVNGRFITTWHVTL